MLELRAPDHVDHRVDEHGGVVMVDRRTGRLYALNHTAGVLWRSWSAGAGFEEGVAAVAVRHPDVATDRLRADASRLLDELVGHGLIRARPQAHAAAAEMAVHDTAGPCGPRPPVGTVIAGFVCLLFAVAVVRLPFRVVCAAVRLSRRRCGTDVSAAGARTRVAAVDRVARWFPCRVACLERSLAAVFLAALSGRRLTWCLGTAQDPYRFHAWVEAEERLVPTAVDRPGHHTYLTVMSL